LILKQLIKILRLIIEPKKKFITYHSFPDFSDNSFSFFCYVINNHKEFKNIWLINDPDKHKFQKVIAKHTSFTNYKIVKKKSVAGLYYYLKSRYVFHTHGVFNNIPLSEKQINVNLWHGMPLKKIGYLDTNKTVPKSNYVISTSKLFQEIMSKAFSIDLDHVLISGQPRNDLIYTNNGTLLDLINKEKKDFDKVVLWMPTYRKSIIGDVRIDGELETINGFLNENYLSKLNLFFESINSVCFVKLHPMDFMDVKDFGKYSNLYFLNNDHFEEKGISLYSILHHTDLLLTDFSSIYIDYLLLDKPMAFLVSDFKQYSKSRGFVFENPIEYMPGEIIKKKEDLIPFLENIFIKKEDLFKEERINIRDVFHEPKSNFSENVFNTIFKNNV
jgi:CDP-glycerol glycerophosphotransferase